MVSSTLCPAVHILGSQNVYCRAEGIADHYWPWAVFYDPFLLFLLLLFLLLLLLILLLLLLHHLSILRCLLVEIISGEMNDSG